jgi:hypothetical protein
MVYIPTDIQYYIFGFIDFKDILDLSPKVAMRYFKPDQHTFLDALNCRRKNNRLYEPYIQFMYNMNPNQAKKVLALVDCYRRHFTIGISNRVLDLMPNSTPQFLVWLVEKGVLHWESIDFNIVDLVAEAQNVQLLEYLLTTRKIPCTQRTWFSCRDNQHMDQLMRTLFPLYQLMYPK